MGRVLIIAEAGVNHNGDIEIAKKLVDVAAESGVDCVKFQTYNPDKLVSKFAPKAEYQLNTTDVIESQKSMLQRLKLSPKMHYELIDYCRAKGIQFLSTPFDKESLEFLVSLGMDVVKISSGEVTNYPFLRAVAETNKEVILSTGMSTIDEVASAINILKNYGAGKVTLLHCTTQYPTPFEAVNLKAMLTMKERFHYEIGYSDHTKGIEVPIAAVAMGATVIEKHFTLDNNMEGPDHKASLEPEELRMMVKAIRNIEKAVGDGIKEPSEAEKSNISVVRKSIVAIKPIKRGEMFTEDNIDTKRPGNGISPMKWDEVIGKKAKRDFAEDELIEI